MKRSVLASFLTLSASICSSQSLGSPGREGTLARAPDLGPAARALVVDQRMIGALTGDLPGEIGDFDLFGRSVCALNDFDGDGLPDLAIGKWHDDDGGVGVGVNSGSVYITLLDVDGSVRNYQKISATQGGLVGVGGDDHFGTSVVSIGDHDGDGVGDLAVGAWHDDDAGTTVGTQSGALYVLFLNANGTVKAQQKISATAGGLVGLVAKDHFGTSVASLGDLDGDGVGDVIVGARGDHDESAPGAVWILSLNVNGTVKGQRKISNGLAGFTGVLDDGDFFGEAVEALGDLDGDGVVDVAVGAIGDDDGGSGRGAVWILFLNMDGTVKSWQRISSVTGGLPAVLDDDDLFGYSLACPGDFDGDGVADLFVGAGWDDDGGTNRGAVYLLTLRTDGTIKDLQKISQTEGGFGGSLSDGDELGNAAAPIGDLNGDGVTDLAVGAWYHDDLGGANGPSGALWVLFLAQPY